MLWRGIVRKRVTEGRPWQDLNPWPSASETASKCPGSFGGVRMKNHCVRLRPALSLAEARVTPLAIARIRDNHNHFKPSFLPNFGGFASCVSATPGFFSQNAFQPPHASALDSCLQPIKLLSFRSSMPRICLDIFLFQVDKQGSIGNVGATRVHSYVQKHLTIGCLSEFYRGFSDVPGCLGKPSGQKTQYVKTCQDVLLGCAWKAVTNSWHPVTNFSY